MHIQETNSRLWHPESTHEKIDSQKMFIENVIQQENNYTELIKRVHAQVDSIIKLKALDVSSNTSTIKEGTMVLVSGYGTYYYTLLSSETADGEMVVAPNTGKGVWILCSGGNITISNEDYGTDTDSNKNNLVTKIKKMFDKKTKTNFFPVTTTKAVRDTTSGKTLFDLLGIIPTMEDSDEQTGDVDLNDADTLGGIPADQYALKSDYNGIICVLVESNWTKQSDNTYTYSISYPTLTGNELFDMSLYDDGTATDRQIDAFSSYVTRVDVNKGEIVVKASQKPPVTFSVVLRGMCTLDSTIIANLSDLMTAYNNLNTRITVLENK